MSNCRLCGGTERKPFLEARGCKLTRCVTCGFVQVEEVPSLSELSSIYEIGYFETGKYCNDAAISKELDRRLSLLTANGLRPGSRILDYGCATGDFVAHAADRGYDAWGVDLSSDALAAARRKRPDLAERFVELGALTRCFSDDRRFNAVVAWDVLEHLPNPPAMMEEIRSLLLPGGLLAVSTPDIGSPVARAMGRRWAFMTPPEHLGFFDGATLSRLVSMFGGRVSSSRSVGKWANVGFILYKLGRIFPVLAGSRLLKLIRSSALGRVCLYVPTNDIRYVVATLPAQPSPKTE